MYTIRAMSLDDYDQVIELMKRTPGISLRDADSHEATARYLQRNPDMSFVAEVGGVLVGCVMCGATEGNVDGLVTVVIHQGLQKLGQIK